MFKKISIFVLGFCAVVIGILLVLPFFYSLDQFRPQIKAAIEKNIQGTVELGKINFRLFPNIRIGVESFSVTPSAKDFSEKPLAQLQLFEVQMPLYSLLVAPSVNIFLNNPNIAVIQKGTENNISALLPSAPATEAPPPAPPAEGTSTEPPKAVGEILSALPPFLSKRILAARLSFEMHGANIEVIDKTSKATQENQTAVEGFDFILKNVGLATPMEIEIAASPKIKMAGASVNGKATVKGTVFVEPQGKNNLVKIKIEKDLGNVSISYPPLFGKPAGTPFAAEAEGTILQSPESLNVDFTELALRFANVRVKGIIKGDFPLKDPTRGNIQTQFNIKDFEITPWGDLVPLVKSFGLGGKVNMDFSAKGTAIDPSIDLDLNFSEIRGATPELKKPLTDLKGSVQVNGRASDLLVKIPGVSLRLGSSDISASIEARLAQMISAQVSVKSSNFNADELLGLEAIRVGDEKEIIAAVKNAPATPEAPPPVAPNGVTPPAPPLDESLNQMAPMVEEQLKNPMLDKVQAKISADFKRIQVLGAEFKDATFNMNLANRKLTMSRTGIKGYGGQVSSEMALDLNPEAFGFSFNAGLGGVRIESMTGVHAPSWKEDLKGEMTGKFSIQGMGLRKEQLEKNLKGGLVGELKQGQLILPVVKMVTITLEVLPSLKGAGFKLPEKDKTKAFRGDFKTLKMDTEIQGRKVILKDLDVNYDSREVGLGEIRFQSNGNIGFDRQIEILGIAYLSPEVIRIPELKGPSGKIEIPIRMTGDMSAPQTDTAYTLKILTERAAKNFLKGELGRKAKEAADKVKAAAEAEAARLKALADEEKRKAEEAAKREAEAAAKRALDEAAKNAPAPVQKGVQDLKKKLKF